MKKRSTMFKPLLMAVAVTACSESNTPIAPEAPQAAVIGAEIGALKRNSSQPVDLVATATIGEKGGRVSVGGVTLDVPRGALSDDTEITLTVPAGDYLQAQFAPHGLTFSKPAELTFNLAGTAAGGVPSLARSLAGVYFLDSLDDGLATALEVLPTRLNGVNLSFNISHFSGYCVSEGRCDCF